MAQISINKLLKTSNNVVGDTKAFFYLETQWLDYEIYMKFQDSQTGKCYHGNITTQCLNDLASEVNESFNDYYEECRTALTTYMSLPGYTYKLLEEECIFQVWKTSEDSIPMLYLEISMKSLKNHYDIFDAAIEELQNNSKTLSERIEKAHKFDEHSRELLEDYRICVEEKNQLEKKLLRKMSVLLNAKKQKISELEERLSKYENDITANGGDEDEVGMDYSDDDEQPQTSRKRRPLMAESESEDEEAFNANTEILTLPEDIR